MIYIYREKCGEFVVKINNSSGSESDSAKSYIHLFATGGVVDRS